MHKKFILLSTLGLLLSLVAAKALSYTVSGGQITANSREGLLIDTSLNLPAVPYFSFSLNNGQSNTFNFFNIWTPEDYVNPGEDTEAQTISATLYFSNPHTSAVIDGITFGGSILWGLGQWGEVVWNSPVTITTAGRIFSVGLSNETFNKGVFELGERGATVRATVKQIGTYVLVPDKGSTVMLLGSSLLAAAVLFRRRAQV
jgi:hypothetical protein